MTATTSTLEINLSFNRGLESLTITQHGELTSIDVHCIGDHLNLHRDDVMRLVEALVFATTGVHTPASDRIKPIIVPEPPPQPKPTVKPTNGNNGNGNGNGHARRAAFPYHVG